MANAMAYGFIGLEHLAARRVADGNVRVVADAVQASVDEYNRQANAALRELTRRTTEYKVRYRLPGGGTLQPLDEWGNPLVVRSEGYHDVAFPIQQAGTAWGNNRVTRALMTVEEANDETLSALQRDADWMRRHMLGALFDNTTWTFADEEHGNLTVQPLANGDAVEYLRRSGANATDNHYYAQAAAIGDAANPFDTWYTELNEHPENAGPYVAYIPGNLKSSVKGLTNFIDATDPNVNPGVMATQLAGRIDRGFGDTVLGYVDNIWVVEWEALPDNYGIVVARGAKTPALMMREFDSPALQGLYRENFSPDGNLMEFRFIRMAGFGAYNRVGALAFRIGNAAWATPTGYATPL